MEMVGIAKCGKTGWTGDVVEDRQEPSCVELWLRSWNWVSGSLWVFYWGGTCLHLRRVNPQQWARKRKGLVEARQGLDAEKLKLWNYCESPIRRWQGPKLLGRSNMQETPLLPGFIFSICTPHPCTPPPCTPSLTSFPLLAHALGHFTAPWEAPHKAVV